jgi:hypothetical protein
MASKLKSKIIHTNKKMGRYFTEGKSISYFYPDTYWIVEDKYLLDLPKIIRELTIGKPITLKLQSA